MKPSTSPARMAESKTSASARIAAPGSAGGGVVVVDAHAEKTRRAVITIVRFIGVLLLRIHIDHPLDGAAADVAEPHLVAREHDAVDLGAIEALRLISRAFERADLAGVLLRPEKLRVPFHLPPEQLVHLRLRHIGFAQ